MTPNAVNLNTAVTKAAPSVSRSTPTRAAQMFSVMSLLTRYVPDAQQYILAVVQSANESFPICRRLTM